MNGATAAWAPWVRTQRPPEDLGWARSWARGCRGLPSSSATSLRMGTRFSAGTEYMDLQNDLGQTALHLAAILGETSTVEKLYAAGAGLCVAERRGHTALHLACRVGAHACARALLQPRPRRPREAPDTYLAQGPDRTPDTNHTPVALYPDSDLEKEEEESEEDWKLQLEAENYEGHTPLHVAVIHKDVEMVRLLRDAGADLDKPEPTCGRSPLHLAVEAQAADVLELLLRAGANPAARMYGGRTPLGSAMLRPNPILARLLRAHGAPEPEGEDEKSGPCSSSSDSDSGDEGDEYDDIVVHSSRSQTRLPPTPASKPLPDDPRPV
ncbi:NF-kappa-B inhibitor beta isoform X1 [Homo sapiens]|uniref:NF-kappa-B inhibitor beta isoform X1 n=1 Tax=Homo sapiens TaxID=9606 RepID=UPI0005D011DF|nr:NF-kappa-B inhibitor beta isoform X1 [Homo sapiens]XP_054177051.1 NF-kappa-B inhibitor beta isoform X1 [Homo sapiens]XP_054187944.1 NF-kappa-B inhibitor beta isoform X1 [Homo sapiens]|eukprot:XP_006723289.2 NF-kappa-B inhibitor beta isoform X1 [Homo sapiens]